MRLDLGYEGTDFAGWARQPGQRTVQGAVEEALVTILRVPARLTVAGRTDAGVHATGQVAHVDLPVGVWVRYEPSLLRRLAGVLPRDVRVRAVSAAPEGFDARFSALHRRYTYRVADTAWGVEPVHRRTTVHWPRPLDEHLMAVATHALLGEHDFAAFCRRRPGATTVRTLRRLDWDRDPTGVLTATVEADAFCHSMVRSLVGALLDVGTRARPTGWPAQVLAAGVREARVNVAPAHGLTLVAVSYPEAGALAGRARETRRRREPRTIGP